jgi:hypothetical protein
VGRQINRWSQKWGRNRIMPYRWSKQWGNDILLKGLKLWFGNPNQDSLCPDRDSNWTSRNKSQKCYRLIQFSLWVMRQRVHSKVIHSPRPLIGLLYQPPMIDDECGAVGGMRIGRGNRSTRRKPTLVPLCPPQMPHDLTCARTRAAAVGSRRLTAWAMARPLIHLEDCSGAHT